MGSAAINPVMSPQQSYILDQFNGQTYQPGVMDVQHTPLYDTVTVAAAGSLTTAVSQWFVNVQGKTIAQTNVQTSKKLDAPQAFTVKSFRWYHNDNILLADLRAILAGCVFEFLIGEKVYQRGPLWNYTAGGGISRLEWQLPLPPLQPTPRSTMGCRDVTPCTNWP
jgi:hypothetical protein